MANTTSLDVIRSFQSIIRDREMIGDDLQHQWFLASLGELQLETDQLPYDRETKEFDKELPLFVIECIAYWMKVRYMERESSRVNKIANIRTRDLTLDGMGDAKRATQAEYESTLSRAKELTHKLKTHWFS